MSELEEILSDDPGAEWVDAAVRHARPAIPDVASMELAAGFDDVLTRIWATEETPDRTRGRRRRVAVSLALAATVVGGGGAAAAVGMTGALTGLFGQPGKTENDTSEYVDATKSDFPGLARRWAAELQRDGLRFAPAYNPQRNIDAAIVTVRRAKQQLAAQGVRSLVQVTSVKGSIAHVAACTWEISWLDAYRSQNQAGSSQAVAGIRHTAGLRIMSQVNAAKFLTGLANDAEHGEVASIQTDVTLNCTMVVK